jgi:integrase
LGLAEARDRARDALQQVRDGIDPATEKQHERQGETVADLVRDYIEKYAKPRKRSWREDDRILRSYVLREWKARQISDIKRRDVRVLVEDIAARGARVMSNRVLATIRKMFSFAVEQELIENNPAARLGRPGGAEPSRDRVLTDEEIRTMWAAFSALTPEMGAYFKLRLVTAQRGKEVASMRWRDVDLDAGWWRIPHNVAKNGLGHRVPLSPTAIAIIQSLKDESTESDTFVLVGARGRRQQTQAAATFRIADFRGHDLRRTAASMMASGGISRLTISKILNHAEKGITAVYDRHSYDAEKQAALGWWDKKLRVVLENRSAVLVQFSR